MGKKVLVTNLLSYLGRSLINEYHTKNNEWYGIVPPKTNPKKYRDISNRVKVIELSLTDIEAFRSFLAENYFDVVIVFPVMSLKKEFFRSKRRIANVYIIQQIVDYCINNDSRLIFSYSLIDFGCYTDELPVYTKTKKITTTYNTLIIKECEHIIERNRLKGLKAVIFCPSCIYGKGAIGFPRTLARFVQLGLFPLVRENIYVHFANVRLLMEVIEQAIDNKVCLGNNYIVADDEPIILDKLVNFISLNTHYKKYSSLHNMNIYIARNIAWFCRKIKFHGIASFWERVSHSWFYDIDNLKRDFKIAKIETITSFRVIIDHK